MTMIAAQTREEEFTGLVDALPVADIRTVAAPVPVLAPYLGLVCAVLSALVGGWLLLAPYAFDYRAGATALPRTALVDLTTGAATVAIGLLAALLFGGSLARRLRPVPAACEPEPEPELEPEPEPEPAVPADDPDGGLRDLLAPLVAALAADLRSRQDTGAQVNVPQDAERWKARQ
jgi:hypothetical protein